MEYLQVVSVPAIAMVVYWIVDLLKYATNNNEKFKRWIPLLSAGLGAILGIVCFYGMPEIIAAPNAIVAAINGGASGLSATGCNQIIKQFVKETGEKKNEPNDKK